MKKVLELIRVSTEQQAAGDRASIPAQRTVNRRTCVQYGLEIIRSIELTDVSGACVLLAPEMQELIRLMQSAEIHGVVAREFSRLMRPENFEDFALLQVFVDSRTMLYLPEGPLDMSSKTGRLLGTIRAAIAGMERTEILERVWTAKEEKRRRGELAQSKVVLPWGVGYEPGRGFYYKPEAERVREAFRQFLAGNQSYIQLSRMVGVTPRGMHVIMRNPIWTGWRIIDKKRDMSSVGRYPSANGRQADRHKIARPPEEVIRVQVISDPLVSEHTFKSVQRIMDLKQARHWRSQPDIEHRFTYNGFLTCSSCGEVVHTALARRDYYACKGRRTDHACRTKYMGREKLEARLDALFAEHLADPNFLKRCIRDLEHRDLQDDSAMRAKRLSAEVSSLRDKRTRVMDVFLAGLIEREDLDRRLATIDRDIQTTHAILIRETPPAVPGIEVLIDAFAPLAEWEHWSREQKRSVLSTIVLDIRVADYNVSALGLNPAIFSNQDTRTGMDSSPPRA
jgi:DNA invertase Pin-like site-specific DNA recombinase